MSCVQLLNDMNVNFFSVHPFAVNNVKKQKSQPKMKYSGEFFITFLVITFPPNLC